MRFDWVADRKPSRASPSWYLTIVQDLRYLADAADYDQIAMTDEEDEFIRAELRRQADAIAARGVP